MTKDGKTILLDEDELKEALERREITKEEFDETYDIANKLIKRLDGNKEKVKEFTDKYLTMILNNN